MNRIYRLVWSCTRRMLVPVSEFAHVHTKGSTGRTTLRRTLRCVLQGLTVLLLPGIVLAAPPSPTLPTGGQVVAGQATINQDGATLTINQSTQKAALDWQSFNIGSGNTVDFIQPGASSIALNRVLGSDASQIFGHLNANGQVFLINPNGALFAPGAQVNVAGLIASTLDLSDQDFLSGHYHFSGESGASITNLGNITAGQGGYIALIGAQVSNDGTINTPGGTAALGAGSSVDLKLAGNQLLSFRVSGAALNALAENGGVIQANGGAVILSAQAKDALLQTVVNNSGVIRAQTMVSHGGTIELLGGESGTLEVAGTLDASAPDGGQGGNIETSGAHLKVANSATITTQSTDGHDGNWLIDPNDFTVSNTSGDITGWALSTALASGNVTIQTTSGNASCAGGGITCTTGTPGNGDININSGVNWTQHTLTLDAWRNININAPLGGSGTAGLVLQYGQGSTNGMIGGVTATYNVNAPINLPSTLNGGHFTTKLGITGPTIPYTIITSLGTQGSTTGTDLQGINGNLSGHYVLGSDINASATSGWNSGAGFAPIGSSSTPFSGVFDGLGHTISNLTINLPSSSNVGLFGKTSNAEIYNIGLNNESVKGHSWVGGLVGQGINSMTSASYVDGAISGNDHVGGLAGLISDSAIHTSYAAGSVTAASAYAGGLVGFNTNSAISSSYATASVSASNGAGGLTGGSFFNSTISNSYATGPVSGSNAAGGIVGVNSSSTSTNSYWDTTTSGQSNGVGSGPASGVTGLTTAQLAAALPTGFSSGVWVNGGNRTTPYLVANSAFSTVSGAVILGSDTSATPALYSVITTQQQLQDINTTGLAGNYVLGNDIVASAGFTPIGSSSAAFSGTFDGLEHTISSLAINQPALSDAGLFGATSNATIRNVGLLNESVTAANQVGGLIGWSKTSTISNSYVTGTIPGSGSVGGLIGSGTNSTISNSYVSASVSGTSGTVGGLIGDGLNTTISDSYATGSASGASSIGGLVGISGGATNISSSYAAGSVSGASKTGGLIGSNANAAISTSYWDTTTSGQANAVGSGSAAGITGLSTAQLGTALPTGLSASVWANGGNQTTPYLIAGSQFGTMSGSVILGSDSSSTPTVYRVITTLQQLQNINTTGLIANYVLGNDIDASATNAWNGGAGFVPLGTQALTFRGVFDGLNHTIANLTINAPTTSYVGLFGHTSHSQIRNLGLIADNVTGYQYVGGLVGWDVGSTFTNDYATGSVTGTTGSQFVGGLMGMLGSNDMVTNSYTAGTVSGSANVGGLAGINSGTVTASHSTAAVTGSNSTGGLVGYNPGGTITNSYASGSVSVSGNFVGSLVGVNYQGTVSDSYATGSVSGNGSVGGLVGINSSDSLITASYATGAASGLNGIGGLAGENINMSTISDSYATGAVSGSRYVGGVAGTNAGSIAASYATGTVSGSRYVGGVVGTNAGSISTSYATGRVTGTNVTGGVAGQNTGTITDSYWDTTTSSLANGVGTGSAAGATGLTTAQLGTALPAGFSSSVWANGDNQTTPYLVAGSSFDTVSGVVILGSDASATPTAYGVITTLAQLQNINSTGLARNYVLGNNVDASATSGWNSGAGFTPIGSSSTPFRGVFDGLGHTIAGLTINRPASSYIGLFGLASNAAIRNVGLVAEAVNGDKLVGGLTGVSDGGTIADSFVAGSVSGTARVGGLTGVNSNNTISQSFATATVLKTSSVGSVGGLVGSNVAAGTITSSHATGHVSGDGGVGGLVGANSTNSTISSSYASGAVSGSSDTGGLVGFNGSNSLISQSYATGSVSGSSAVGGLVGSNFASTISNAYATGNVIGTGSNVGGLVGSTTSNGAITDVFAMGSVTGTTTKTGGLVGSNSNDTITHGYWDTTTSGQASAVGQNSGTVNATGLDDTQMQQQANFAGFDFTNTWIIYNGHTNPLLRAFMTPLTVTSSNQTQTYDGGTFTLDSPTYSVPGADTSGHLYGLGNPYDSARNADTSVAQPDLWSDQQGYIISYAGGSLTINPRPVTLTGNRVYDSTSTISGSGLTASNLVAGDSLTVSGQGTLLSKNVGNETITDLSGLILTNANYTLAGGSGSVNITPASLTLQGLSAADKVYDATTTASATGTLSGVIGSDDVSDALTASFDNKNVGTGKTVTVNGITLGGNDAGNYTIGAGQTTTANITPASLTLAAVTDTKVYDGTTSSTGTVSVSGLKGSDTVSGLSESFASKNVLGTNASTLEVNSSYTVNDGNGGANYSVTTDTAAGTITPASLTLTGLSAANKVYDGTTTATATASLNGIIGSDSVTDTLSATFDNKNVGTGKTVTVDGITLGGTDAGNYTTSSGETTTANITPAPLTLAANSDTKTYDSNTNSTGTVTISGLQGSDTISGLTQSYDSKNVEGTNGSTLGVSRGYTIHDGNNGNNYTVTTQTAAGTIAPLTLTLTGLTVADKAADGSTAAIITNDGSLLGILSGDSVSLDGSQATASFASPQPGLQTVNVTGLILTGADAMNYLLASPQQTSAEITPANGGGGNTPPTQPTGLDDAVGMANATEQAGYAAVASSATGQLDVRQIYARIHGAAKSPGVRMDVENGGVRAPGANCTVAGSINPFTASATPTCVPRPGKDKAGS